MIGRADIEGSKSGVAMNAWPPQASYPCGNFSDTPAPILSAVTRDRWALLSQHLLYCFHSCAGGMGQGSFCPYALREISVLAELPLGHLCYPLTDVPPQPNSPPDLVVNLSRLCWWP